MLKDKCLLQRDLRTLGKKCKSCGELNHFTMHCPCLNYQPFKDIIIKRHLHSKKQRRKKFFRNKKSINCLRVSEALRGAIKRFQEEKTELINLQIDSMAITPEIVINYQNLFNKARDTTESKEFMIPPEGDEIIINCATNINEPACNNETDIAEKRERALSLEHIRMNNEPQQIIESLSDFGQIPKPTSCNNLPVGSYPNLPDDNEKGGEESKAFKAKKVGQEQDDKKNTVENNSEIFTRTKKTMHTIISQNAKASKKSLYERDFDKGHVFNSYFPYNNKNEVLAKFSKNDSFNLFSAKKKFQK